MSNIEKPQTVIIGAGAVGGYVGGHLARAGFDMEPIVSVPLDHWVRAADGNAASVGMVEAALFAYLDRQTESGRKGHGSLGRDILAGRRSEIDFVNGMIADKGDELGVSVPIHRALTTIVRRIERGELTPSKSNIVDLIAGKPDERRKNSACLT